MSDLAIDRALTAVREADGVWSDLIAAAGSADVSVTREEQRGLRAALAILKAAQACDAAWGTPGLYAAQQALHAAIRGEP